MFGNNAYLLPQVAPSLHPGVTSSVVGDLNGVDVLLHHHPNMLSGHYLAANAPVVEADALLNQDVGGQNGDPASMENTSQRKPTVKKDRHSKIYTAQGPRDRRVRLSKGIARKFFDLQEMLGFEKPSKTLDWLLTKSRRAIKELLQTIENRSMSSPSECEVLSSAGNGESLENGNHLAADSWRKSANKYKGAKDPEQQASSSFAKESRAKARARARERTREKMSIKQVNGVGNTGSDLNPYIPIQYRHNQLEVLQFSGGDGSNSTSCFKANAGIRMPDVHGPVINEAATEDLNQEYTVIRRNSKNPSFLGYQQNLSRDLSSNYIIPSANATDNWDICSFTSQSNLCAIWDQHKFINSA